MSVAPKPELPDCVYRVPLAERCRNFVNNCFRDQREVWSNFFLWLKLHHYQP